MTSVARWATKVTRQQGHPVRHANALSLRLENILIHRGQGRQPRSSAFLQLPGVPAETPCAAFHKRFLRGVLPCRRRHGQARIAMAPPATSITSPRKRRVRRFTDRFPYVLTWRRTGSSGLPWWRHPVCRACCTGARRPWRRSWSRVTVQEVSRDPGRDAGQVHGDPGRSRGRGMDATPGSSSGGPGPGTSR